MDQFIDCEEDEVSIRSIELRDVKRKLVLIRSVEVHCKLTAGTNGQEKEDRQVHQI